MYVEIYKTCEHITIFPEKRDAIDLIPPPRKCSHCEPLPGLSKLPPASDTRKRWERELA